MKPFTNPGCLRRPVPALFATAAWLILGIGGFSSEIVAQITVPVATPADSPIPTASPIPTLDPYRQLRTPSATVTVAVSSQTAFAKRLAHLTALANGGIALPPTNPTIQPIFHGGVFDEVSLGYLSGTTAPALATITLQFDVSRAGSLVWIQPFDGGTILTQDTEGNAVNAKTGCSIPLNAQGQLGFQFQALAHPGRYQLLVRLDSVSTILPFVILDPTLDE